MGSGETDGIGNITVNGGKPAPPINQYSPAGTWSLTPPSGVEVSFDKITVTLYKKVGTQWQQVVMSDPRTATTMGGNWTAAGYLLGAANNTEYRVVTELIYKKKDSEGDWVTVSVYAYEEFTH